MELLRSNFLFQSVGMQPPGCGKPGRTKGFVNLALCEGSVHTIRLTISRESWSNVASRNDGDVLGPDFEERRRISRTESAQKQSGGKRRAMIE